MEHWEIAKMWYGRGVVKYNLLPQFWQREQSVRIRRKHKDGIHWKRNMYMGTLKGFDYLMKRWGLIDHSTDGFELYSSVGEIHNDDFMSMKRPDDAFFDNHYYFFDLDGNTLVHAYKDAMKLHDLFAEYGIDHSITFSGRKGFHVRVPRDQITVQDPFWDYNYEIASVIKNLNGIKSMDLVYQQDKVLKAAYTLDFTGDDVTVVYPMNETELDRFDLGMVLFDRARYYSIKNRGIPMFKYDRNKKDEFEKVYCFFDKERSFEEFVSHGG